MTDMRKWMNLVEDENPIDHFQLEDEQEGLINVSYKGTVVGYIEIPEGRPGLNDWEVSVHANANKRDWFDGSSDDDVIMVIDLWEYVPEESMEWDDDDQDHEYFDPDGFWERDDADELFKRVLKEVAYPALWKAWDGKNNKMMKRFRR